MKRNFFLCLLLATVLSVSAAEAPYYLSSAFGYGGSATGGGSAKPTLVSSASELKNALKGSNKVIIITKDITMSSMISAQNLSNITLLGMPGVTLSNLQTSASNSGVLYIKSSKNIIIRNLTFVGPGAYDVDGNDLLCFDGVTNAWVDHCDFQDGLDGCFDNKKLTDNVTVSWCRFRYLKAPIPGGSGGADDHRFPNLLGASATDAPSDGTYNFTWAYCWWDSGCKQRMVRCRNASLHFLNCYWDTSVADYYIGPENADAYVEGCWMAKISKSSKVFYENFSASTAKNGVKYVNSYYAGGTLPDVNDRKVLVPTYQYTALTYDEAKKAVTNSSCGAGATLDITTSAQISASCSSEPQKPDTTQIVDPQPIVGNLTWSADDSDISSLGTIASQITVRGLTFVATADKNIVVDNISPAYTYPNSDLTFSHRIKLGGSMAETTRHLELSVTGNCTIEIYCRSANNTAVRPMAVAAGSWNNYQTQQDVDGTQVSRVVYEYVGKATTLYLGGTNGAINIMEINLTYDDPKTNLHNNQLQSNQARKIIIEGNLYIETADGELYTPVGTKIR